jgi:hypothetical protein
MLAAAYTCAAISTGACTSTVGPPGLVPPTTSISAGAKAPPAIHTTTAQATTVALPNGVNCALADNFVLCSASREFNAQLRSDPPVSSRMVQVGVLPPDQHLRAVPVDPADFAAGDIVEPSPPNRSYLVVDHVTATQIVAADQNGRVAPWTGPGKALRLTPDIQLDATASQRQPMKARGWTIFNSSDRSVRFSNGVVTLAIT